MFPEVLASRIIYFIRHGKRAHLFVKALENIPSQLLDMGPATLPGTYTFF
jgi:hypothetical protein